MTSRSLCVSLALALCTPCFSQEGGRLIPEWAKQQVELVGVVREWVAGASERQREVAFGRAATDEANFMFTWLGYYQLTGDERALETAERLFDGFRQWLGTEGHLGYYPQQEAHHGTEPFLFFPTRLYQLGRRTETIRAMYRQVADHCGNWSEGVPDWYDWDRHVFRSYYLGTRTVRADDAPANQPDHFRFVQIALAAHRMTGEQRYLDLANDYVGHWARAILAAERGFRVILPADADISDHHHLTSARQAEQSGDVEAQLEWHLAGGALDTFLDLYRLSPQPEYAEVFRRALPVLLATAREQWGHPAAALIGKYRDFTGDRSFDGQIRRELESVTENVSNQIRGVRPAGPRRHPMGIAQRFDMVIWEYRQPDGTWARDTGLSPGALVLLYRLTGDRRHLALAMKKARQRMAWAVANLKDGREHADAGWCIAAVAGGHGRNYAWGELSSALYPVALGSWNFCGEDLVRVTYAHDGRPGLPEGVAALYEPADPPRVVLVNTSAAPTTLTVAFPDETPHTVTLEPGEELSVAAAPPR
ncbi:MAG: hypothetical protein ACE5R4_06800 [Armatimonadota bacterium]